MKTKIQRGRKTVLRSFRRYVPVLWAVVFFLAGCAAGGKSPIVVHHYSLEYDPPSFKDVELVNESVRVEPFSIARNYNGRSMVYRPKPYHYSDDAYHRWRVKPIDMISDLFLRDIRSAGLFQGVFSCYDVQDTGYVLSGMIEEFYETEDTKGSRAILAVNMTLRNVHQQETASRTVFQKGYRYVQAMEAGDAESLARAMSRAMEALSKEIILDTYAAIRRNRNQENNSPSILSVPTAHFHR